MTRAQIEQTYNVREAIIYSPGKFEGEPVWAPYFYDLLEATTGEDEDGNALIPVTDEDRAEFPELAHAYSVRIRESDEGFVHTSVLYNWRPKMTHHQIQFLALLQEIEDIADDRADIDWNDQPNGYMKIQYTVKQAIEAYKEQCK
jgi:hypothetical protein